MAERVITEADNGQTLSLHVGDMVTLHLPEKAAAGYQWVLYQIDSDKVTYTKLHDGVSPHYIGGEHLCTFLFTAKEPGIVHIQLKHWRPWEGDTSTIGHYTMTFVIQP